MRAMSDQDVSFTADAPATTPEDWATAVAHRGLSLPVRKQQIALRVDADVLLGIAPRAQAGRRA